MTRPRTSLTFRVVIAVLAAGVMFAVLTGPASASRRFCTTISYYGHTYPVRVLKGDVSCTTARSVLSSFLHKYVAPRGWHCVYGHGQDIWSATCYQGRGSAPRTVVRAYNPTS